MSDMPRLYCQGYLSTPIIEACLRRGLFDLLDRHDTCDYRLLAGELGANAGYLKVALDAMEALGWVEEDPINDTYRLIRGEANPRDLGLMQLYGAAPEDFVRGEVSLRSWRRK